jgi:hypothetical protein
LHELSQRLRLRQAAHAEWLAHQRRGGPRQPGTRSGVFPKTISHSERVLLTILHFRKLCTLDVLADALCDVSRSAIGNAVRETRPLWDRTAASHPQRTDRRFASWCRITSGPGIEPLPGWASVAISQDQHNINS